MGQPTPPGDIPLYEGLGTEWNDIVGALPEDKRSELASTLKSRIDSYAPLKQWEEFQKQGITPDQAGTALNLFNVIETNPKHVYETLGNYLGITPQEAKAVVKEVEKTGGLEGASEDPRIATMQNQIQTLVEIQLAQRQQSTQEQQISQQEELLNKEIDDLKNKFGDDVNEREILMRMLHEGMTAQQAHEDYSNMVSDIRRKRPSPMLMGNGGIVPRKAIDPTKLDNRATRDLVAQMMQHAIDEERKA